MDFNKFLLAPEDCAVLFIDHQPQEYFGITSSSQQCIRNHVIGLAKATQVFKVPFVLTTIAQEKFNGPTVELLAKALGNPQSLNRSNINAWEDEKFVKAVKATKRKKLVITGLWTDLCCLLTAISAIHDDYEVFVVTDTCGSTSPEAHERAIQRMIQAGVVPVTWLQVMMEWQRDWTRKETAGPVRQIAMEHAAPYGIGIEFNQQISQGLVTPEA